MRTSEKDINSVRRRSILTSGDVEETSEEVNRETGNLILLGLALLARANTAKIVEPVVTKIQHQQCERF
jgi:hypothetical protein